jgi:hypothetical protein
MVASFTKGLRVGLGFALSGIATGFLFNIRQDIYVASKGAITHPLPFQIIIPVGLGLAGIGIILFDVLSRRRRNRTEVKPKGMSFEEIKREELRDELRQIDEDIQDPKAKSERDGKSRPSGIT